MALRTKPVTNGAIYFGAFFFFILGLAFLHNLKTFIVEGNVLIVKKWMTGTETRYDLSQMMDFDIVKKSDNTASQLGLLPQNGKLICKFKDESKVSISHVLNNRGYDLIMLKLQSCFLDATLPVSKMQKKSSDLI